MNSHRVWSSERGHFTNSSLEPKRPEDPGLNSSAIPKGNYATHLIGRSNLLLSPGCRDANCHKNEEDRYGDRDCQFVLHEF